MKPKLKPGPSPSPKPGPKRRGKSPSPNPKSGPKPKGKPGPKPKGKSPSPSPKPGLKPKGKPGPKPKGKSPSPSPQPNRKPNMKPSPQRKRKPNRKPSPDRNKKLNLKPSPERNQKLKPKLKQKIKYKIKSQLKNYANRSIDDILSLFDKSLDGAKVVDQDFCSELLCQVCGQIFTKPYRLKCGCTFCKKCVIFAEKVPKQYKDLKDNKDIPVPADKIKRIYLKRCPNQDCRKPVVATDLVKNFLIEDLIAVVKVYCENKRCSWMGPYKEYKIHRKECMPERTFNNTSIDYSVYDINEIQQKQQQYERNKNNMSMNMSFTNLKKKVQYVDLEQDKDDFRADDDVFQRNRKRLIKNHLRKQEERKESYFFGFLGNRACKKISRKIRYVLKKFSDACKEGMDGYLGRNRFQCIRYIRKLMNQPEGSLSIQQLGNRYFNKVIEKPEKNPQNFEDEFNRLMKEQIDKIKREKQKKKRLTPRQKLLKRLERRHQWQKQQRVQRIKQHKEMIQKDYQELRQQLQKKRKQKKKNRQPSPSPSQSSSSSQADQYDQEDQAQIYFNNIHNHMFRQEQPDNYKQEFGAKVQLRRMRKEKRRNRLRRIKLTDKSFILRQFEDFRQSFDNFMGKNIRSFRDFQEDKVIYVKKLAQRATLIRKFDGSGDIKGFQKAYIEHHIKRAGELLEAGVNHPEIIRMKQKRYQVHLKDMEKQFEAAKNQRERDWYRERDIRRQNLKAATKAAWEQDERDIRKEEDQDEEDARIAEDEKEYENDDDYWYDIPRKEELILERRYLLQKKRRKRIREEKRNEQKIDQAFDKLKCVNQYNKYTINKHDKKAEAREKVLLKRIQKKKQKIKNMREARQRKRMRRYWKKRALSARHSYLILSRKNPIGLSLLMDIVKSSAERGVGKGMEEEQWR